MSYIAKIYLNKMFPKKGDDAISLDEENNEILFPMINVINPIEANDVPESIDEYFEIEINGKPLAGKEAPAEANENLKLEWVGKDTYTLDNYQEAKDEVLPVGEKVVLHMPNHLDLSKGDMLKIVVKIHQDSPITFRIRRKLQ